MNIRKAKKLYPNNTYLKEIISHLKSGNKSKYKLAKGKHHKMKNILKKLKIDWEIAHIESKAKMDLEILSIKADAARERYELSCVPNFSKMSISQAKTSENQANETMERNRV